MVFKVEFSFNSLDDLKQFLEGKTSKQDFSDTPADPIPAEGSRSTVRGKKLPASNAEKEILGGTPVSKIPFKGPQPETIVPLKPKAEEKKEEKKPEPSVKYDDVADATTKAVKAGHRAAVIDLLKKHGAINEKGNPDAKAMDASNWPAYIADCQKLISEPDEDALT